MSANDCGNVEWCRSEIGDDYSAADLAWARWMWWCDCADCPPLLPVEKVV